MATWNKLPPLILMRLRACIENPESLPLAKITELFKPLTMQEDRLPVRALPASEVQNPISSQKH